VDSSSSRRNEDRKNWVAAAKLSTFKYSQRAVVGTRYRLHVRLWAKELYIPYRTRLVYTSLKYGSPF
jgi:hypothetical protein